MASNTLSGERIVVDLKSRDYEDFRRDLIELIPEITPEWTDLYPHDPGVVLLELMAYIADNLSHYTDRAVEESLWGTAKARKSIVEQAKLIGYTLSSPTSSTVNITVTTDGTNDILAGVDSIGELPFRIATKPAGSNTIFSFELLEEYEFALAETEASLVFIEGQTFIETLGISTGKSRQSFTASKQGVTTNPDGTYPLNIFVNEGAGDILWGLAPNNRFLDSETTDEVYVFEVDVNNRVTITFGDGTNGRVPPSGAIITLRYRIGGGIDSHNIGQGKISTIATTGTIVTAVTNPSSPSGGSDAETVEEARINAPKYFATQNRIVTHRDYEALALTVPGVQKVRAVWNGNTPLIEAIYIATTGDNPIPSGTWDLNKQDGTGLIGTVGRLIISKNSAAIRLNILPISTVNTFVTARINVLPTYRQNDVKARVQEVIEEFIYPTASQEVLSFYSLSDLIAEIEAVRGVKYSDVLEFYRDPVEEKISVGYASTTFESIETSETTKAEDWIITFTSGTSFQIEGSVSGPQLDGTIDVAYSTSQGELSFVATSGAIQNVQGDKYRITTGGVLNNISMLENQLALVGTIELTMVGGIR